MSKRSSKVTDRIDGYPKTVEAGRVALTDFNGKIVAKGRALRCVKVKPHERGAWISNERCSYQFYVERNGERVYYAGRGRGDGIAVTARRMKKPARFHW